MFQVSEATTLQDIQAMLQERGLGLKVAQTKKSYYVTLEALDKETSGLKEPVQGKGVTLEDALNDALDGVWYVSVSSLAKEAFEASREEIGMLPDNPTGNADFDSVILALRRAHGYFADIQGMILAKHV